MATYTKLSSGSWRVQVRRKGRYVSETFLRRDDARRWATETERQVDRGETPTKFPHSAQKTFRRTHRPSYRRHVRYRQVPSPLQGRIRQTQTFRAQLLGVSKISHVCGSNAHHLRPFLY